LMGLKVDYKQFIICEVMLRPGYLAVEQQR
jgi:hypothetical protein